MVDERKELSASLKSLLLSPNEKIDQDLVQEYEEEHRLITSLRHESLVLQAFLSDFKPLNYVSKVDHHHYLQQNGKGTIVREHRKLYSFLHDDLDIPLVLGFPVDNCLMKHPIVLGDGGWCDLMMTYYPVTYPDQVQFGLPEKTQYSLNTVRTLSPMHWVNQAIQQRNRYLRHRDLMERNESGKVFHDPGEEHLLHKVALFLRQVQINKVGHQVRPERPYCNTKIKNLFTFTVQQRGESILEIHI